MRSLKKKKYFILLICVATVVVVAVCKLPLLLRFQTRPACVRVGERVSERVKRETRREDEERDGGRSFLHQSSVVKRPLGLAPSSEAGG